MADLTSLWMSDFHDIMHQCYRFLKTDFIIYGHSFNMLQIVYCIEVFWLCMAFWGRIVGKTEVQD